MAKTTKEKLPNIDPCVYAGDEEDEYCSECNGVTMMVNGEELSCTECQGYTPPEPKQAPKPETHAKPCETPPKTADNTDVGTYTPQGIVTTIKAESGLSIETKQGWYRFAYAEERVIPDTADLEQERHHLWNDVNREVDRQAEEVKLMLTT